MASLTELRTAFETSGRRLILAVLLGALLCGSPAGGQDATAQARRPVTEYEVKAAFLLNFAKFIEWPESREPSAPVTICTLGDDPFGPALDRIVAGETINNRSLVVRRLRRWQEPCDVVFIANNEPDVPGILRQVGHGVLTVGESPEFLREGGMINFVIADRRVRFDVNRKAADRASVRISSRLLGVARDVLK